MSQAERFDILILGCGAGEALDKHRHLDRVHADVRTGCHHGVTRMPTFFVNGRRHDGADEVRALTAAIRKVLSS